MHKLHIDAPGPTVIIIILYPLAIAKFAEKFFNFDLRHFRRQIRMKCWLMIGQTVNIENILPNRINIYLGSFERLWDLFLEGFEDVEEIEEFSCCFCFFLEKSEVPSAIL